MATWASVVELSFYRLQAVFFRRFSRVFLSQAGANGLSGADRGRGVETPLIGIGHSGSGDLAERSEEILQADVPG